jgi:putative Ca2+/H+ antiporter (TMEM165/GDT1 family)
MVRSVPKGPGEIFGFRVSFPGGVGGVESLWSLLRPRPEKCAVILQPLLVSPFLVSGGLVAIAEIGDKTQLLAMLLAARFLNGPLMKWVLGLAFIAFGAWALIPDKFEDKDAPRDRPDASVFITTAVAFFFVEMGDKTQVATVALAARFHQVLWVAAGTTLGMMLANVPAVFLSQAAADRLPLKYIRWAAAASFAALGVWVLIAG